MLTNSYQPELLNLRTFPTLMGYSSRILAESWESNLLFYAALADQVFIRPAESEFIGARMDAAKPWSGSSLPTWSDWPALLRSLRQVGDDVVQKARKQMVAAINTLVNSRKATHSFRRGMTLLRRLSLVFVLVVSGGGSRPSDVPRQSGYGGAEFHHHRHQGPLH